MFWGNSDGNQVGTTDYIMFGLGICFEAIHCIAWHFSFLTDAELLMGQILCVAMTTVPVYFFLVLFSAGALNSDIVGVTFIYSILAAEIH